MLSDDVHAGVIFCINNYYAVAFGGHVVAKNSDFPELGNESGLVLDKYIQESERFGQGNKRAIEKHKSIWVYNYCCLANRNKKGLSL